jgi:alpha-beta hydrolase superfamily lysophospholipase
VDDSEFVREPAAKADLASDPLIDHANLPARSAAAGLDAIADVQRRMEQVKVPLFIMHGTGDKATNPEGSRELYARAGSADKTLKLYDGMFHDLLHEPERDRIIHDVTAWISARAGAQETARR